MIFMINSTPKILLFFFFFNDTATTEIYTLSLHDALPIFTRVPPVGMASRALTARLSSTCSSWPRSEEHTSELQSQSNLVCRLLLEKKKKEKVLSDAMGCSMSRTYWILLALL